MDVYLILFVVFFVIPAIPFLICFREVREALKSLRKNKRAEEPTATISPFDVHPSVVAAVCAGNSKDRQFDKNLLAALLRLAKLGNVRLSLSWKLLSISIDEEKARPSDPLDSAALDFFQAIGSAAKAIDAQSEDERPSQSISFSERDIEAWEKSHYEEFLECCSRWEQSITSATEAEGLVHSRKTERRADRLQTHYMAAGGLFSAIAIGQIFACVIQGDFKSPVAPTMIILVSWLYLHLADWVFNCNSGLTRKGEELVAACDRLKNSLLSNDGLQSFEKLGDKSRLDAAIVMVAMGAHMPEFPPLVVGEYQTGSLGELLNEKNAETSFQSFKRTMQHLYHDANIKQEVAAADTDVSGI